MDNGAHDDPQAPEEPDRLLLVDDNPTNLQVLYQTLNGRGYKLLVAKNGEDALKIAAKALPNLVLLDIMMPGIDGFEVCERLKADPQTRHTAVIFLSALDDTKDKVKGLAMGAVDYVSKPFNAEEVIARVETHLKIQRLERSLSRRNSQLETVNRKMRADLEAAARVQQSLLPSELPQVSNLDFSWRYRPCEELGGDGLNIFRIDERYIGIYVLDVSGHGVPSALLAVTVSRSLLPTSDRSSLVRTQEGQGAPGVTSPAEVARRLNDLYPMDFKARLYFTLLYGVWDTQESEFRFVSAGIPGPILLRQGQAPVELEAPGVPVGLLPDSEYEDGVVALEPGDRIYLHSDGLVEEMSPAREEYGRDRLMQSVADTRELPLETSLDTLINDVARWRGEDRFKDDVSIIALQVAQR